MRGRFAPSPTGTLHLGNLRTALAAWLFARSAGSTFSLRFEDLDTATVTREHYDSQRRDLDALGLGWDDELCQSHHLDRYRDALAELERRGLTYRCYCSRREIREAAAAPHVDLPEGAYPGTCRELTRAELAERDAAGVPAAIRLRTDHHVVEFVDRLHGPASAAVDDLVLARRDGTPAYNLVVVLDDAYQAVEEVVRGDDLLRSTPRQLHLGAALGLTAPSYAHVPLVLGPDGTRLAKRDGAVTLPDRLALGETAADVRARLAASLGLCAPDERPSPADLVARFSPDALPRNPWRMSSSDLAQSH